MLIPDAKRAVHPHCMTCHSCDRPFGPADQVFMKPKEKVVYCVDCKRRVSRGSANEPLVGRERSWSRGSGSIPAQPSPLRTSRTLRLSSSSLEPMDGVFGPPSPSRQVASPSSPWAAATTMAPLISAGPGVMAPFVVPPPPPSKATSVEPPLWVSTFDPTTDDVYYINTKSSEVTWDRPPEYSGVMVGPDGRPLDAATRQAREARARLKRPTSQSAISTSPILTSSTASSVGDSYGLAETSAPVADNERKAVRKAAAKRRLSLRRQKSGERAAVAQGSPAEDMATTLSEPCSSPEAASPQSTAPSSPALLPASSTVMSFEVPPLSNSRAAASVGRAAETSDKGSPGMQVRSLSSSSNIGTALPGLSSSPRGRTSSLSRRQSLKTVTRLDPATTTLTFAEMCEMRRLVTTAAQLDPARLEEYLSGEEFLSKFGMDQRTFGSLPQWKRDAVKRSANLI